MTEQEIYKILRGHPLSLRNKADLLARYLIEDKNTETDHIQEEERVFKIVKLMEEWIGQYEIFDANSFENMAILIKEVNRLI